ncbi:MAG: 16S rRNA (cytosine(1402)-N(4))-methyltransferase RsmH [Bacteroidales bacterium]|nr:16S rRNA (cytosine(1402)-N(4))-methyltransferase RsmH [Bacteroidales bacterium]MCF8404461.1 16S rRNA (cytosine(1402)-N(4))-methyltransferase RsmH [Bacteroidales bacterium]
MYHNPVLLKESIEGLNIRENGIYVDATYGGGGHSNQILKNFKNGSLIAFDQDQDALENKLDDERLILINQNFRYMRNFLKLYKAFPVDGILADLGVSSHQFDVAERGFSVRFDGDLDLRMNQRGDLTASRIVNTYQVNKLRDIFYRYGDLKNAGKISFLIEKARSGNEIKTTGQLKEIIQSCAPRNQENKFFAKVFQALRIEVNDELGALEDFLKQTPEMLKSGGRLVVISYHSLEDRLVKNFIKSGNFEGKAEKDFYGNIQTHFQLVSRKPIVPSEKEIIENNRARSAKLRIAEKK